jgi:copper transport protein
VLSCEEVREAISARLDNEPATVGSVVADHLADCTDCSAWADRAQALTRRVRLAPVEPAGPDDELLSAVRAEWAADRVRWRRRLAARMSLGVVATAQLVLGIALLAHGSMPGMKHMDHELLAFNVAVALGFGFAAVRPTRARGMLPITGITAAAIALVAIVDVIDGSVGLWHETQHLVLIAGWLLLWAVARTHDGPGLPTALAEPEFVSVDEPDEVTSRPRLRSIRPRPPAARHVAAFILIAGVAGTVVLNARPAFAHAVLEQTSPTDGSVIATAPKQVTLDFGEPVGVEAGAVRVFDDRLHRVDKGNPTATGAHVRIALKSRLAPGTYTVTWRVISADSHPVAGGFTFSIGHPSSVTGQVKPESGGSRLVGILLGIGRYAGYAGVVLGVGTAAVLLVLWPAGWLERRPRRLVWTGWGLLFGGTIAGLLLEGPYGAGVGITHLFDGGLLRATFDARYGEVLGARFGLLLLLAVALRAAVPRLLTGLVMLAILVTFALAGHAATGGQVPFTVLSDVLHVGAMAGWMGGLALLVGCLASRVEPLGAILPQFSRFAFGAVVTLVVTGTYQAWRNVGSWSGLPDTVYGRLLLAKIGCVVLLVGLGNVSRRWVARHYATSAAPELVPAASSPANGRIGHSIRTNVTFAGNDDTGTLETPPPTPDRLRMLRRGLAAEATIGAVVLVLTAILVNTAQAKETRAAPASYSTSSGSGNTAVQVTAKPTRTGQVTLTLQVRNGAGKAIPVQQVTAALSLPSAGIDALPVHFSKALIARPEIAKSGSWLLDVTVQTSPTLATAFRLTIPIH